MIDTTSKDAMLAAIEEEHAAWRALVAEVGPERYERPGITELWTFKDLVAHLTGWRMRTVERLEAAALGEPEPPPPWPEELTTDDEINAWIYEQARDEPAASVLARADTSFTRLRDAVAALPIETLMDPKAFPWTEGGALGPSLIDRTAFDHLHDEHEPALRKWLTRGSRGKTDGRNGG